MSTKIGSQQKQSLEDNTGGRRTNTPASRYNQHPQVEAICARLAPKRQMVLATATATKELRALSEALQRNPKTISAGADGAAAATEVQVSVSLHYTDIHSI